MDLNEVAKSFIDILGGYLFYEIMGFPMIVLWVFAACLFFTFRFNFINIRLFGHAIEVLKGKNKSIKGDTSAFQSLMTAASGTIGIGNIAGVAVAIQMGGPGAILWMIVAGFFAMSLKLAEATISCRYRITDDSGQILGGPFVYLKKGLEEIGLAKLGSILAMIFSFLYLMIPVLPGGILQSNQTVSIIMSSFNDTSGICIHIISFSILILTLVTCSGGIGRIAKVASALTPTMAAIYVISAISIVLANSSKITDSLYLIVTDAFSGKAIAGGTVGVIAVGLQRAFFACEAGLGSTSIEHAAAKVNKPIDEGAVASLEPIIGTMIICSLTGLMIVITGVYSDSSVSGILITNQAFKTVSNYFSLMLSVSVALFCFSTIVTNSYHGERAWVSLFGTRFVHFYRILFSLIIFAGCYIKDFGIIMDACDIIYLYATVPNLIAIYLLRNKIAEEIRKL